MFIGNIEIENKLLLAPIAGYTDSPYRRIARHMGAGLVMTELISADGIIRQNQKTLNLIRFHESERPLGVQIFGYDVNIITDAACMLEEYDPDFIDINMGCPARKVCKTGSGAALIRDPEKIYVIVKSVTKAVSLPVTAKIRIGWDDDTIFCFETIEALEKGGVSAVFVHGRTREQMYSGYADWDIIKEICAHAHIPVIGNGDIMNYKDALKKMALSHCSAVMIGRAALGNPWIFSGIKPNKNQIIQQIKDHLELMLTYYGEYGVILFRKHLVKYIHDIHGASKIRSQFVTIKSRADVYDVLDFISNV